MTQTEAPYNPNGVTLPSIILMDYAATRLQSPHELTGKKKTSRLISFSAKFALSSQRAKAVAGHNTFYIICSIALESPPRNKNEQKYIPIEKGTYSAGFLILVCGLW